MIKTFENFITDIFKKKKVDKPPQGSYWFIPYTKEELIEKAFIKLSIQLIENQKAVEELIKFFHLVVDDFPEMLKDKKGFYLALSNENKWTLLTDINHPFAYMENYIDKGTVELDQFDIDVDKYNL